MYRVLILFLTLFVTTPYAMSMQGEMASINAAHKLALAQNTTSAMEQMASDQSSCCCCQADSVMQNSMNACITTLGLLESSSTVSPVYRSTNISVPAMLPVYSAHVSGIDRPPIQSAA
ncbi:hypothetical protein [Pseudovibrio sp. Tun.PSC04-5.I4]|uniref:hypothetical protein n=1 Tax=Pseudovibrio sp. Tun.PSC04-5.I4 TaxID=1798213 RepID=UPI00087E9B4D|nr:hypothetical protein [Pseudovibrio sp. Tun.PSC04-5.I4]SDR47507.1 hypothetical protein SAMN04515695_5805 [Pseudovibrio sp. Tun.PSC04-5.I4]